jgi:hypothetical protein
MTWVIIAIATISCVPTRTLLVDIPLPAQQELPASIQSLTLVSQAVSDKYTDLNADSLQRLFYKKNFDLDTVIYDFQMADTTLKALGELLFESGRYEYVIPEDRFIKPSTTLGMANEIPWEKIRWFCETFQTDAVLSLDHLNTRVIARYENETYFNPFQGGFYSAASASMKIYYEVLFRLYEPKKKKVLIRQFISDTLYWEDEDVSTSTLFNRFTSVKDALSETGIVAALELSERIAGRWRPERRKYFTAGNARFREANQLAEQGEWLSAISIWNEIIGNTNSKILKSKALLNMALGYEMLGDLNRAVYLALESYRTMYRPLTYEYLEVLNQRRTELKNTK